jgi:hypothetical protein
MRIDSFQRSTVVTDPKFFLMYVGDADQSYSVHLRYQPESGDMVDEWLDAGMHVQTEKYSRSGVKYVVRQISIQEYVEGKEKLSRRIWEIRQEATGETRLEFYRRDGQGYLEQVPLAPLSLF